MGEWMKEIRLLLRIQAYRFCGVNVLIHGRDKRQRRHALGQLGIGLLLAVMAAAYPAMIAFALLDMGLEQMAPHLLALAVAALTLGAIVVKGPWLIFGGNDISMLRAMPVRTSAIVVSRLVGILVPELSFALLIGISAGTVLVLHGVPLAQMIALTLGLCLIPALPTALALLIGVFTAHMTLRLRHRAAVSAVLSIALVVAVLAGTSALGFGAGVGSITEAAMLVVMGRFAQLLAGVYPPADWLADAMQGSAAGWLMLVGTAVLALGLLVVFASAGFVRVSDALLAGGGRRSVRGRVIRPTPPVISLYKKEWLRFTGSSIYMMNTSVGWIMLLVIAAMLCVVDVGPYLPLIRLIPRIGSQAFSLLPVIPAMIAGIAPLTACAVSMEGRHIELMRALPVRMRDWLGAKLLLHMTFAVPSIGIACTIAALRLRLDAAQTLLVIAYPLVCAMFTGVLGLAVNLRFPRFDWNEEAQVVKNGLPVLLTMLAGIFLPLGVGALGLYLGTVQAVLLAAGGLKLIITIALWRSICRAKMP